MVPKDGVKSGVARKLLAAQAPFVSSQVLQEFVSVALKKNQLGINAEKIDLLLRLTVNFPFQSLPHLLIVHADALRRGDTDSRTGTAPSSVPRTRVAAPHFIRKFSSTVSRLTNALLQTPSKRERQEKVMIANVAMILRRTTLGGRCLLVAELRGEGYAAIPLSC